jgi:serine/threonine protein kinase
MEPIHILSASITRLFNKANNNKSIVGVGFLVTDRHVLTCAHVVRNALGYSKDESFPEKPNEAVYLDFPLLGSGEFTAQVITWHPNSINNRKDGMDIAVLELTTGLPKDCQPVCVNDSSADFWGHPLRVFGFPSVKVNNGLINLNNGVWANYEGRGPEASTGWVLIEKSVETGHRIQPGFSGSPVWDEQLQGVVGMVVALDTVEKSAAFMIPANVLSENVGDISFKPCSKIDNQTYLDNVIKERDSLEVAIEDHDLSDDGEKTERLVFLNEEIGRIKKLIYESQLDEYFKTEILAKNKKLIYRSHLGMGGSGKVWKCYHQTRKKHVAIKVLLEHLQQDLHAREQFIKEVEIMMKLEEISDHIIKVHNEQIEYDESNKSVIYYMMEYVEPGFSLLDFVKEKGLSKALQLFVQACYAIHQIHEDTGIIHRDLKPSNLLVNEKKGEYSIKICDFGFAKDITRPRFSSIYEVIGTIGYSAPEQLDDPKNVTSKADIFSLGMVLSALLLKRDITYHENLNREKLRNSIVENLSPYTKIAGKFAEVVLKATYNDPKQRYTSADRLGSDVRSLLNFLEDKEQLGQIQVSDNLEKLDQIISQNHSIWIDENSILLESIKNLVGYKFALNYGVCLIDFIGDVIDSGIQIIPKSKTSDVVYLNPNNKDRIFGFNVMQHIHNENRGYVVSQLVKIINDFFESPLRESERILLKNCLRVISRMEQKCIFTLNALSSMPKHRNSIINQVNPKERKAINDVTRHFGFNEQNLTVVGNSLKRNLDELFSNNSFVNIISQIKSQVSIPFVFSKKGIGLFDFRSNELSNEYYNFLISLIWLQYDIEKIENSRTFFIINGAEKLNKFNWNKLVQIADQTKVIFIYNDFYDFSEKDIEKIRKNNVILVSLKEASFFEKLGKIYHHQEIDEDKFLSYPNVVCFSGKEETFFDEKTLRKRFSEDYKVAGVEAIHNHSKHRYTTEVETIEERISRFTSNEEEIEESLSIGGELDKIIKTVKNTKLESNELVSHLALLAFKTGHMIHAQKILDLGMIGEESDIRFYYIGATSNQSSGDYPKAFEYCKKGIHLYNTWLKDGKNTKNIQERFLSLLRLGFKMLIYDIKKPYEDMEFIKIGTDAIEKIQDDNNSMLWQLKAKLFWYTKDQDSAKYDNAWEKALQVDETGETYNAMGTWYKDVENNFSEAENIYRKGLEKFPNNVLFPLNLAKLLIEKDEESFQPLVEALSLIHVASKMPSAFKLRKHIFETRETIKALKSGIPKEFLDLDKKQLLEKGIVVKPKPAITPDKPLSQENKIKLFILIAKVYIKLDKPSEITLEKLKPAIVRIEPNFDHKKFGLAKFKSLLEKIIGDESPIKQLTSPKNTSPKVVFNEAFLEKFITDELPDYILESEAEKALEEEESDYPEETQKKIIVKADKPQTNLEIKTGLITSIKFSPVKNAYYGFISIPDEENLYFDSKHVRYGKVGYGRVDNFVPGEKVNVSFIKHNDKLLLRSVRKAPKHSNSHQQMSVGVTTNKKSFRVYGNVIDIRFDQKTGRYFGYILLDTEKHKQDLYFDMRSLPEGENVTDYPMGTQVICKFTANESGDNPKAALVSPLNFENEGQTEESHNESEAFYKTGIITKLDFIEKINRRYGLIAFEDSQQVIYFHPHLLIDTLSWASLFEGKKLRIKLAIGRNHQLYVLSIDSYLNELKNDEPEKTLVGEVTSFRFVPKTGVYCGYIKTSIGNIYFDKRALVGSKVKDISSLCPGTQVKFEYRKITDNYICATNIWELDKDNSYKSKNQEWVDGTVVLIKTDELSAYGFIKANNFKENIYFNPKSLVNKDLMEYFNVGQKVVVLVAHQTKDSKLFAKMVIRKLIAWA